jgi:hypothetical protein
MGDVALPATSENGSPIKIVHERTWKLRCVAYARLMLLQSQSFAQQQGNEGEKIEVKRRIQAFCGRKLLKIRPEGVGGARARSSDWFSMTN